MDDDAKVKLKTAMLAGCFIFLFRLAVYWQWNRSGIYRQEYSAYVIEKQARPLETDEGGFVNWVLIVQDLNGNRFPVKVNAKIYQQAQPGAFIEKRASDIEPTIAP